MQLLRAPAGHGTAGTGRAGTAVTWAGDSQHGQGTVVTWTGDSTDTDTEWDNGHTDTALAWETNQMEQWLSVLPACLSLPVCPSVRLTVCPSPQGSGALDMSLPSTPDVRIKEEEPLDVDSSPPESPAAPPLSVLSAPQEGPPKAVVLSTPTPTIVRPGSLPLHLGYDSLHAAATLPSPTSVITQAPPASRHLGSPSSSLPLVVQLANGQTVPVLPGPPVQMPSVISVREPSRTCPALCSVLGGSGTQGGSPALSGAAPVPTALSRRLKASLAASSSLNGSSLAVGSASTLVTARPEQSQGGQHPDTPSPAQPQVSPAQPTPSSGSGGRRRRAADEDPDERRQRFLERNRAAASRCRQKRKLWVSSLEKKAEELTSQNIQLSNEVTLLRNEVAQLKQLLLAHKDCPVTALQKKSQGYLESPKESSEPSGSPAPVIQHSSASAAPNGLRSAAEAVASSVLAHMAGQRTELAVPAASPVIMAPQGHSAGR
uniref:BZIP domain-containing protein n=1 Tax=Junco hyemalis TaxID=40217 RepID=A0A8C5JKK5_JUNHY